MRPGPLLHWLFLIGLGYGFLSPAWAHPEDVLEAPAMPVTKPGTGGKPLYIIKPVPFIGSPVHEKMTIASINLSRVHQRDYKLQYDDAYIRGVFWNDDPLEMLCPACDMLNLLTLDKRLGFAFGLRFNEAKTKAKGTCSQPGYFFQAGDGLLERSHFGDLQFLHAMAAQDGELASETQAKIVAWAEFAYRVAVGDIEQRTLIAEIPVAAVQQLLVSDPQLKTQRVEDMFRGPAATRRVAIGTLLHMVQDSYASGHAEREEHAAVGSDGKAIFSKGMVKTFHSYTHQDSGLHRQADAWPAGLEIVAPDANDNPISVGAQILSMVYKNQGKGEDWTVVRKYLLDNVFKIENPDAPAGPGNHFKEKKPCNGVAP